jgi:putative methyltransferase
MITIQLFSYSMDRHPVLPYTCALLEKMTNEYLSEVETKYLPYKWQTISQSIEEQVQEISKNYENIDIFGFSIYNWTVNRSIKAAKLLKKHFPNALFVAGGPFIAEDPDTYFSKDYNFWPLKEHFDILVHGEGEFSWLEIVREFSKGSDFKNVKNCIITKDDYFTEIVKSKKPLLIELKPYFDNPNIDLSLKEADDIGIRRIAIWETSRGCPYSCAFCTWGTYTKQKIRFYDMESLKEEARWLMKNVDEINLADANFGIAPRDVELAKYIVKLKKEPDNRLSQIFISSAKNNKDRNYQISKMFVESDLISGELVGIQDLNEDVMKISQRENISLKNQIEHIENLRNSDIPFYFDMIYCLPGQTPQGFLNSVGALVEYDPTDLRVFGLSLIPNSDFYRKEIREEYNIQTKHWKIMESSNEDESEYLEVVKCSSTFTEEDIKYVQQVSRFIVYMHTGKILYYIANGIKKIYNIPIIEIYQSIVDAALKNPESYNTIFLFASEKIFKKLNSGYVSKFDSEGKIFGITDKIANGRFRKQSWMWLASMHCLDEILEEVEDILFKKYGMISIEFDEILENLILYQKTMLIKFDYASNEKILTKFNYDVHELLLGNELKNGEFVYEFSTNEINGKKLISKNQDSYINVAGDNHLYPKKKLFFTHTNVEKLNV